MRSKLIEATNGTNWGRFFLGRFDESEWAELSVIDGKGILRGGGNSRSVFHLLDLVTGEGALFEPHGVAEIDLNSGRHQIWVCPMFEPTLVWLYKHRELLDDLDAIPQPIELPRETPSALYGYRRVRTK